MSDNSLDIITVFNPDSESFHIVYNNQSYGHIEPGKARRMPRFLAKLAVKHLVDQILNRQGIITSNQEKRDFWVSKVVMEEEVYAMPSPLNESEKIRRDMEEMNKNQDLDRILEKRKAEGKEEANPNFVPPQAQVMTQKPIADPNANFTPPAPVQQPPPPASVTPSVAPAVEQPPVEIPAPPKADLGVSAPTGESKVLKEVDNTDLPASPTGTPPNENVVTKPTREQLYTYAEKVLGMTLADEKTKAALDSQNEDQLMETLGYDSSAAV